VPSRLNIIIGADFLVHRELEAVSQPAMSIEGFCSLLLFNTSALYEKIFYLYASQGTL